METPKRVAIIHKDSELISVLANIARGRGYSTATMVVGGATRAVEVASFVRDANPNLVLLAENYQGNTFTPERGSKVGEGIEALAEIRRSGYARPIFMVSGNPLYEKRAMQEGANSYLNLPITIDKFREFLASNTQS